jgi:hypothetical protein
LFLLGAGWGTPRSHLISNQGVQLYKAEVISLEARKEVVLSDHHINMWMLDIWCGCSRTWACWHPSPGKKWTSGSNVSKDEVQTRKKTNGGKIQVKLHLIYQSSTQIFHLNILVIETVCPLSAAMTIHTNENLSLAADPFKALLLIA